MKMFKRIGVGTMIGFTVLWGVLFVQGIQSSSALISEHQEDKQKYLSPTSEVEYVIDGDTVIVNRNGKEETVRLIGIDTPEMDKPECYAHKARAKLQGLVGEKVAIDLDVELPLRDKYGRLLAYIYSGHTNINLEMIKQGYAYEYTYDQPYEYQQAFRTAEQYAQDVRLGIRNNCY